MESSNSYISSNTNSDSGDSIHSSYQVEEIEHSPVDWISLLFLLTLLGLVAAVILLAIRLEENNNLFIILNESIQNGTISQQ